MCTAPEINTANTIGTPNCPKKLPFTSSERELLVALVRERPIIEDKRTNAKNIELKKQAWDELAAEYNALPYVFPRNSKQLKRCWENIKTQRKKELSQESAHMTGIGGGLPQAGSTVFSNNAVDDIYPHINVKVPGVIDSKSIEISDDIKNENDKSSDEFPSEIDICLVEINENIKRKPNFCSNDEDSINITNGVQRCVDVPLLAKKKCLRADGTTSAGKLSTETETRIKRCLISIQHDQELHNLRLEKEKILIEREKNLLQFEKEMHNLQLQKLKLELEMLKKDCSQKT